MHTNQSESSVNMGALAPDNLFPVWYDEVYNYRE